MPSTFNPKITSAGLAAAIAANGTGLQLAITHIALGAAQYDSEVTADSQTSLADRREKVTIAAGVVSGIGGFRVSALFPEFTGTPYLAGEIGFYAGDPDAGGVLFAVYSSTASTIVSRSSIQYAINMALQLARVPSGSVTVQVDISQSETLAALSVHIADSNAHPQYVKKIGDTMSGQLTLPGGGSGNQAATINDLLNAVATGQVAYFASANAPNGYLKANGAQVSRATYSTLWAFAQASGMLASSGTDKTNNPGKFYVGNGSTTFTLPDLRGEFLRAYDDGRGVDSGRVLGAQQADAARSQTYLTMDQDTGGALDHIANVNAHTGAINGTQLFQTQTLGGGAENRPRNTALLACIKY